LNIDGVPTVVVNTRENLSGIPHELFHVVQFRIFNKEKYYLIHQNPDSVDYYEQMTALQGQLSFKKYKRTSKEELEIMFHLAEAASSFQESKGDKTRKLLVKKMGEFFKYRERRSRTICDILADPHRCKNLIELEEQIETVEGSATFFNSKTYDTHGDLPQIEDSISLLNNLRGIFRKEGDFLGSNTVHGTGLLLAIILDILIPDQWKIRMKNEYLMDILKNYSPG
jgi:hypothetical protein